MADQELTALKIRIEAEVKQALAQLDSLATKIVSVEATVKQSVGRINASLNSFSNKTVDVNLDVKGKEKIAALEKQIAALRNTAGVAVNAPSVAVSSKVPSIVPSEADITKFVSSVKSGIATSINEVAKFRSALGALFAQKKLELGVDNTQVLALKKDLEFLNGFLNNAKREVKVRVKAEGDEEIRNKLANLQKSFALEIIPTFEDTAFQKLLGEIQNKRINLTFEDVSTAIQEEIRKVEAISANLPIGADTAKYDAKLATLRGQLVKVNAISIDANTAPAELSLKQLQQRAYAILAKQTDLKIRAQIQLPSGELSQLQNTKRRLEAQKLNITGKADLTRIYADLDSVSRRIAELNKQGVRLQVTTGDVISQAAVDRTKQTADLIKRIKTEGSNIRIDVNSAGLSNVNAQANQTVRNFEQIIRDTPSFAISAQQGFIAISNNIGPLTDSFGRLAAEAKASGQSIGSALGKALGGWNAIGIAISVAVTAVAFFSKELFGASKSAEKLNELFKKIKETIDETKFVVPIAEVSKSGEEAKVKGLAKAFEDGTLSIEEQARALQFLKGLNSEVFGGFEAGKVDINNLNAATQKYINTLRGQSIEQGRIGQLNKLKEDQVRIDKQIIDSQRKINDLLRKNEAANAQAQQNREQVQGTGTPSVSRVKFFDKEIAEEKKKQQELLNLQKELIINAAGLDTDIQIDSILNLETKIVDSNGGKTDDTLKKLLESRKRVLESELSNISKISKRAFEIQTEIAGLDLQLSNIGEVDGEIKFNNCLRLYLS